MSAPVEVASSSSSQDMFSIELEASLVLWIYQDITPEHKDSLCKIAAIAAACHIVTKEGIPENFGKLLAFELYSGARGEDYKPRQTRVVAVKKWTNNMVRTFINKKSSLAESLVNIEIGVRRYQVNYVVMLDFQPIIVGNMHAENISPENLLLTLPADFHKIFEDMKTPRLETQGGIVLDTDVQKMVADIARICQPAQVARTIEGKLAVTLDVTIKLNTDVDIVENDKDFISRRIALIIVMHLSHKIQSPWIDFNLHTAWELFLKLQKTNYAEPYRMRLHYEVDNVNIDGSRTIASLFKGKCSMSMKNKSPVLNYKVSYAYQPNPPERINEDLMPGEVKSLDAVPLDFSTIVKEVERRRYYFAERSNIPWQRLADEVATVCLPAEMD
ncbi:uncharacterized protein LOC106651935 [Trichogramma pretiosum]|uniref:uncharacterized protein LOC106651935 n=1 Tax=Trichogramma pretiosum TaxID=7493 RepID=UPI000C719275|nr:uncharacterized protein LOC106651935 [Trichogramma pretiosum]